MNELCSNPLVEKLIELALSEDLSLGDVTTESTVPGAAMSHGNIHTKESCVIAGQDVARRVFHLVDPTLVYTVDRPDGSRSQPGSIGRVSGCTRSILMAERTALNFLQRLSGIATHTANTMELLSGLPTRVVDTRKTTPGWRLLEKYAVRMGGGANHRINLGDGILIKDNHIHAAGGITSAVTAARRSAHHLLKVEVEVSSIEEADEAVLAGAEALLLDNMDPDTVGRIVRKHGDNVILEASGGIHAGTIRSYAETGVHYISVGALTHSSPSIDIALDFE